MAETFNCFSLDATIADLAGSLNLPAPQVRSAVDLLLDGNTLPFIARYRKEATGGLDETQLRALEDGLTATQELAARMQTVLKTIAEQGSLNDSLRGRIQACTDRGALEEIYLPFKPKRRTRATIAKERGLEPLAQLLLKQERLPGSRREILRPFIDPSKDVPDEATALSGACDIIAERWSEDTDARILVREQVRRGRLVSKVKRGKRDENSRFSAFFDASEPVKRVPSHRFLAMQRGESEGELRLTIGIDDDDTLRKLRQRLIRNHECSFRKELHETVEDCLSRLLHPGAESTVLSEMKAAADMEAIDVFVKNLRKLLLAPPAGPQMTIGLDPGFRTGCKIAVVDETGKFIESATVFPTPPKNDEAGAAETLLKLIRKHGVQLIAIGNGTASRESDAFVAKLIRNEQLDLTSVTVSESGASIYSASELAAAEYPELDVTVRGAISIAHRLQDPLAELVKLDPRSIGVGQYQHDVNQQQLRKSLEREVLSCVNSVGVDLNRASASLLAYVSGIGPKLAAKIVAHRDANGSFETRAALKDVSGLGAKVFQQAAGFLRVPESAQPLDNSAVHPESYYVVERMAESIGIESRALVGNAARVGSLEATAFVDEKCGELTVLDILDELGQPGRDPRNEFRTAKFKEGVNKPEDLSPGMMLEGTVTNVTKFGAFVDVGVHQDGLVHISELANQFIEDPSDVVSVGDVVRVKVLTVDLDRKRIGLSIKQTASSCTGVR